MDIFMCILGLTTMVSTVSGLTYTVFNYCNEEEDPFINKILYITLGQVYLFGIFYIWLY